MKNPSKKQKFFIALALVIVLAGPVLSMTGIYASGTWRYRLIIEVETPEGVKTGSAVREISNSDSKFLTLDLPEAGNPATIRGEAVMVDLGERGVLFVLIDHNSDWELYSAFPTDKGPSTVAGIRHYNGLRVGEKAPVVERYIPKMVTFADMNDPKSVKLVRGEGFNAETQKTEFVNNFEALFGKGVRLKSVTVEVTKDQVSQVVKEYMLWLEGITSNIDGTKATTSNLLSNTLHTGNFKKGH